MSRRGAALLLSLLIASLLAALALGSALLANLHLQAARNRALALEAEAAARSGAVIAEAQLASAVATAGALPAGLALAAHPQLRYRLRSYRVVSPERASLEIEGSGVAGGRALVGIAVVVEGGRATFRRVR